jgi:hypothetical protein
MAHKAAIFVVGFLLLASAADAGAAAKARHWYTPWRKAPVAAPVPTHELLITGGSDAGVPLVLQYWNRNNLRIDLTGMAGAGSLSLKPIEGGSWPVRIEFAVRPGSMGQLEVRGEKRVIFNVPAAASANGAPEILELGIGVYTLTTAALAVSWQ